MKTFDIHPGIITSNWVMDVDTSKCKGCGECANACPIDAINIEKYRKEIKRRCGQLAMKRSALDVVFVAQPVKQEPQP
jgi:Fe-S-cluster-containing hydrogenase component 2